MHYILKGHTSVVEPDILKWAAEFETSNRIVNQTQVSEEIQVSTVFLGIDHSFGMGDSPILFETMIFGGTRDQEIHRYATWDQAAAGHRFIVGSLSA